MLIKPMLAAHPKDAGAGINAALDDVIRNIETPVLGSIKYDGIRCTIQNGKVYTRSLKLVPNLEVQDRWGFPEFNGLDAEITVGPPNAHDVFNKTTSIVMSQSKPIGDDTHLHVIDHMATNNTFLVRRGVAMKIVLCYSHLNCSVIEQHLLESSKAIFSFEKQVLAKGYEGIMLRSPYMKYKEGRSTVNEGGLIAIKRFVDAEAEVLSVYEQMENTNEKETNELGRSKRSHAQAGMVGKDTLGGFCVRLLKGRMAGVAFNVGTGVGLTNAYRSELWATRKSLKGKIVKLKYQDIGTIDAPRIPIFMGFRDRRDT